MAELNPENECAGLYEKKKPVTDGLKEIFEAQEKLQRRLKCIRSHMTFIERMNQVDKQWRNLCVEFGELMQRMPYKEWKAYDVGALRDGPQGVDLLEIKYEYIDMAHFFINIGIALGIDWEEFYSLYMTKNKENNLRQEEKYAVKEEHEEKRTDS